MRAQIGHLFKHHFALRVVRVEVALEHIPRLGQRLGIHRRLAVERGPLRLLQRQAQGQAHLAQALPCQQRTNILVGIEVDADVARNLIPPLRPTTGAVAIGGQAQQGFAAVLVLGCQLSEVDHLVTQGAQLQKQSGTIRLRGATQGQQRLGHLLAGGKGAGVVLFAEDFIGTLHQGLGAADVLQCGKTQAGQA